MIRLGCNDQILPINAATYAARTASKNAVKLLMMFKSPAAAGWMLAMPSL
jgi:hypothetical protein